MLGSSETKKGESHVQLVPFCPSRDLARADGHPEIARMTPRELADLPLVPPMAPAREATRDSRVAAPAAARPAAC